MTESDVIICGSRVKHTLVKVLEELLLLRETILLYSAEQSLSKGGTIITQFAERDSKLVGLDKRAELG